MGGYWSTFVRPRAGAQPSDVEAALHSVLTGAPDDPPADQIAVRLTPAAAYFGADSLTSAGVTIIGLYVVRLVLVGLVAGVFIAAMAERYMQSQRVGFMPNETSTWVAVLVLILIFGIGAALRPAIRAAQVDPNVALREL
jgi:hypothetical protein